MPILKRFVVNWPKRFPRQKRRKLRKRLRRTSNRSDFPYGKASRISSSTHAVKWEPKRLISNKIWEVSGKSRYFLIFFYRRRNTLLIPKGDLKERISGGIAGNSTQDNRIRSEGDQRSVSNAEIGWAPHSQKIGHAPNIQKRMKNSGLNCNEG